MATLTWTGGASADWTTAGNWSASRVPGPDDFVLIDKSVDSSSLPLYEPWMYAPSQAQLAIRSRAFINDVGGTGPAVGRRPHDKPAERYDILLAEGLPVETDLDTGDRWSFEDGGPA